MRQGAEDRILLKAEEINKKMANMELKLREFGQVSRRKASGSILQRHKPASSMLFDDASFAGDRSSLMTAHSGIRAKASRLIIK